MTLAEVESRLYEFRDQHKICSKGALAVMLHISRFAKNNNFPLIAEQLITDKTGQVQGLGRSSVQRILNDYGIHLILAEEGGRTSRGSLGTHDTRAFGICLQPNCSRT
jgi:Domain of unknown function (DUF4928)